jgi:two-component system LytT family response regulator
MSDKTQKVIIIDDEKPARDILRKYLSESPDFEVVAECENGFEGVKEIMAQKPDLIFLDIQMPKLSGFEMLELLDEPPVIIFCTAYDEFALQAFEVHAADYLLKPFSRDRFNKALERASTFLESGSGQQQTLKAIRQHHEGHREILERVTVRSGAKVIIIPVREIVCLEAQDDYVMLYTGKDSYLKQQTMKYFERHLDENDFIRVHRSYIVRIEEIKSIESHGRDAHEMTLKNGRRIPVSNSGYGGLKRILKNI